MNIEHLKTLEGQRVELTFRDGHKVRCRLVDVDVGSTDRELIYDDLEIMAWGSVEPGSVRLHDAAAASMADLVAANQVPGE